jgi:predicted transcriptional regulator
MLLRPFWLMCQFGMAISLTKKELQLVQPIFIPAESALVLTNDYWSWDREYYLSKRAGAPKIVNSIDLFMRTEGMTVEEAREKVKRLIISYEADYLRLKSEFYQTYSEISPALRRYIEVCGAIVAGNHYWLVILP